jgi:DNA polymerase elongation subunit (family B)
MIKGANIDRAYTIHKNSVITHYVVRGEDGKRYHIKSYIDKPYFFAKTKPYYFQEEVHQDIKSISDPDYTTECGEKVCQVIVKVPKSVAGYTYYEKEVFKDWIKVPPARDAPIFEKSFEANIEFPDRCSVDRGIRYGICATSDQIADPDMIWGYDDCKVMPFFSVLDLEVRTYLYDPILKVERKSVDFPDVYEASNPILSIACLDAQTEEIYLFRMNNDFGENNTYKGGIKYDRKEKNRFLIPFPLKPEIKKMLDAKDDFVVHEHVFFTERSMIEYFIDFVIDKTFDAAIAFNGSEFDYPYFIKRCQNLRINYHRLSATGYVTARLKDDSRKRLNKKFKFVKKDDEEEEDVNEENDIRIVGLTLLDSKILYMKKLVEKRARNGLDDFSMDLLNVGKAKHDEIKGEKGRYHSIEYEFFEQLDKFRNYACRDVILDFYCFKYLDIANHLIGFVKRSGCRISQAIFPRKRVRQTRLFYGKKNGVVLEPERYKDFKSIGATVIPPSYSGKVDMAADFDIKSQYPSIIQAFNISWDTLVIDHSISTFSAENTPYLSHIMDLSTAIKEKIPLIKHPVEGIYFRKDKIGIFPQIITDSKNVRDKVNKTLEILVEAEELLFKGTKFNDLEEKHKAELLKAKYDPSLSYDINIEIIEKIRKRYDNEQKSLKIEINSVYGNLPPFLRQCVTLAARELIGYTRLVMKKLGYPSHYTDTDSVIAQTMCKTVIDADKISRWIVSKLNESYVFFEDKYNCFKRYFSIKSEEIYNPIIFITVKSSKDDKAASKVYIKTLVADRGTILTKPKLEHKGVIKYQKSSRFAIDMGYLLIYYCGMNYSSDIVVDRMLALIKKLKTRSDILEIPKKELNDMKNKRISLHEGRYELEDIAFPVNIRKSWDKYKVLDYVKKGILVTNDWCHTWSTIVRRLDRGDTAFMIFVKLKSIPEGMPQSRVWALDGDGKMHPDFKIDYKATIKQAIEKYSEVLKVISISSKRLIEEQSSLTSFFK